MEVSSNDWSGEVAQRLSSRMPNAAKALGKCLPIKYLCNGGMKVISCVAVAGRRHSHAAPPWDTSIPSVRLGLRDGSVLVVMLYCYISTLHQSCIDTVADFACEACGHSILC